MILIGDVKAIGIGFLQKAETMTSKREILKSWKH